jgi:hypothetical protein
MNHGGDCSFTTARSESCCPRESRGSPLATGGAPVVQQGTNRACTEHSATRHFLRRPLVQAAARCHLDNHRSPAAPSVEGLCRPRAEPASRRRIPGRTGAEQDLNKTARHEEILASARPGLGPARGTPGQSSPAGVQQVAEQGLNRAYTGHPATKERINDPLQADPACADSASSLPRLQPPGAGRGTPPRGIILRLSHGPVAGQDLRQIVAGQSHGSVPQPYRSVEWSEPL